MTIRHTTLKPTSAVRTVARHMQMFYPATQAAYILAATASSAMTVDTALTLLETTTRGLTSISFTPGGAPASAFTFTIRGENQFGEPVTESVTTGTSANIVHSLHCYRFITSITPTAKSSTAGDTVAIGWTCVVTSGTPRLALLCKPQSVISCRRFGTTAANGAMPTFTAEISKYTVAISANPLLNATVGGIVFCHMDENDPEV